MHTPDRKPDPRCIYLHRRQPQVNRPLNYRTVELCDGPTLRCGNDKRAVPVCRIIERKAQLTKKV